MWRGETIGYSGLYDNLVRRAFLASIPDFHLPAQDRARYAALRDEWVAAVRAEVVEAA